MAYSCKNCKESFQRRTMLDRHECISNDLNKTHACEDCGECFNSALGLSNHDCKAKNCDTDDKPTLMKCSYCKARFTNENTLRVHERVHTGDLPYKCRECGAKFPYHSNLRSHLRIHNDPIDRPHKCNECGAKFSQVTNLEAHLRTHGPDRTTTCNKCFSVIPEHCIHTCKQETGECFYVCRECNARFTVKNTLEVHMRTHTGEKPYRCTHCGERFSQTGALHSHIRTHTARLIHECGECSQRFRTEDELREHVRTHDQFILHKCKICFGAFANEKRLLLHMRQKHAQDEDMLQCDRCSRSFSTGSELQTHIREMHSEADSTHSHESESENYKYSCSKCAETFYSVSYLQAHKHAKHSPASSSYVNTEHRCDDCRSTFTTSNRLIAHRRTKHPEKLKPARKTVPSATITSAQVKTVALNEADEESELLELPSVSESRELKRKETAVEDVLMTQPGSEVKKKKASGRMLCEECNGQCDDQYDHHSHEQGYKCEKDCSKCNGARCACKDSKDLSRKSKSSTYKCNHCKHKFVSRRRLKAHKYKHHRHCKAERKSSSDVNRELVSASSSSGGLLHKCPECCIMFSCKRLVKLHLQSVHKVESHECSVCSKICVQPCDDARDEPFVCISCKKSREHEMEVDSTTNNDFEEESSSADGDVVVVPGFETDDTDGEEEAKSMKLCEQSGKCILKVVPPSDNIASPSKKKYLVSITNAQSAETEDMQVGVDGDRENEGKPESYEATVDNGAAIKPLRAQLTRNDKCRRNNAGSNPVIGEVFGGNTGEFAHQLDTYGQGKAGDAKSEGLDSETSVLACDKSLQEQFKPNTEDISHPTNPTLIDLVPKLITTLVGNSRLEDFGWPDIPVADLLERVIRHCGEEPVSINGTTEDNLNANCKVLFEASIGKEETSSLLQDKTVRKVILEVITLSEQDSIADT